MASFQLHVPAGSRANHCHVFYQYVCQTNICTRNFKVPIVVFSILIFWFGGKNGRYVVIYVESSPLAVKRDITVTILQRCMCVRPSVRQNGPDHNSYIYGWISKLFDEVVVL